MPQYALQCTLQHKLQQALQHMLQHTLLVHITPFTDNSWYLLCIFVGVCFVVFVSVGVGVGVVSGVGD